MTIKKALEGATFPPQLHRTRHKSSDEVDNGVDSDCAWFLGSLNLLHERRLMAPLGTGLSLRRTD